ncbi:hypothetical protein H2248_002236 [Termitomyces sp. 'cryptogamus']|nr:hypothetical protein H2248_002236 [Termitomyces sp. 'cryptogamus']
MRPVRHRQTVTTTPPGVGIGVPSDIDAVLVSRKGRVGIRRSGVLVLNRQLSCGARTQRMCVHHISLVAVFRPLDARLRYGTEQRRQSSFEMVTRGQPHLGALGLEFESTPVVLD